MKAMILAAGFGSRLGDLTRDNPKCLMPLGDKVILDYVVERLKRAGVSSLVINLHYLADKVRAHVAKQANYGLEVVFSDEPTLLGTGGGILKARPFLEREERFIVHNADVYSELSLAALVDQHCREGNAATLAVMRRETKRPLLFDSDRKLVGWQGGDGKITRISANAEGTALAFSGIHVISNRIWPSFDKFQGAFSIISVFMEAAKSLPVRAYDMSEALWVDIGTSAELERLRSTLRTGRTPGIPGNDD